MRSSSQTSTVTSQFSPSHCIPLTDSGRCPVSSRTVARADLVRSSADRRPFFDAVPASSAMASPHPPLVSLDQPFDELVLGQLGLLLGDLPRLAGGLELDELRLDRALVVVLALGLLEETVGDPDRSSHGRQRQGQQASDQAHARTSLVASSPVKLNGGSGPT